MSKIKTKETKPKAKTAENIKYKPIPSQVFLWFQLQGLKIRKLEFEKWAKTPRCGQNQANVRLEDVLKTSVVYVFRRRLQDVLINTNTFVLVIRLQDSTSWKNVFKTSSRRLQDFLQRCLQGVFKTFHQVELLLLARLQGVFETHSTCFWDALQRRLPTEGFAQVTLPRNLWSAYKICRSAKIFSSFSSSFYYNF